jgi:hypothetical protein
MGESIGEILKSVESEIKSSKKEYTSEKAKADKKERAQKGGDIQKAAPEREHKGSGRQKKLLTRQVQKPR